MPEDRTLLIDIPMPIETPRLTLRNVLPGDGKEMHAAKMQTWEMLHRWMPWATDIGTEEDSEANIRQAYADFILRKDLRVHGFEKSSGEMVVFTGLHRFDWKIGRFEIGYWVEKDAQGKGYATEAANALTRYAFKVLGAKTVVIDYAEGNEKSQRVIEKLGFEKEGCAKKDLLLPDGTLANRYRWSRENLDGLPALDVTWETP